MDEGREQDDRALDPETLLVQAGRDPHAFHGFVNPPIARGSTILFPDVETMEGRGAARYSYGLTNTPTLEALTGALTALEGAAGTVLVPSGLAAVTLAILAVCRAGDRLLVPDNVYQPTRRFCDRTLRRYGVETVYYDPMAADGIGPLIEAGRTHLFLEAPGSNTFETPDIPALVASARAAGGTTMIDNTWATPLLYRPLDHGIDLSIQAGTKYYGGHSDLLLGSVSVNAAAWSRLQATHRDLGVQAGPEDAWLTLRGLRTLAVRLERHERSALAVASWLASREGVRRVLHPALDTCPGHDHWRRIFGGRATGLFAFELDGTREEARRFLNTLRLFGLGYSWGGFESLAVLADLADCRTVRPWSGGPVIRLHIGLEAVDDLTADLERAFRAIGR